MTSGCGLPLPGSKRGSGFAKKAPSLLAVLVTIAALALGAGCGRTPAGQEEPSRKEGRRETTWGTSRWKPPSSIASSGTLNPEARRGTSGPFIAYAAETNGSQPYSYEIFAVPVDTESRYPREGSVLRLTDGPWDDNPSVSPDGETVVYEHSEGDPTDAWEVVRGSDGGISSKDVVPPSVGVFAVSSYGGGTRQVTPAHWMTPEGWSPMVESKPGTIGVKRDCTSPSFSPDGKSICLVIRDRAFPSWDSTSALATMPSDGSSEPQVIYSSKGSGDGVSCPKYSPDGRWIYFCSGGGIKREPAEGGSVDWVIRPHEMQTRGGPGILPAAIPYSLGDLLSCEEEESEGSDEAMYLTFDFARDRPGLYAVAVWGGVQKRWPTQIELMGMEGEDPQPIYGGSDSIKVRPDQISVSPDGKWLAFSNGDYGGGNQGPVYTLDLTTLKTRVIADGDHPCFGTRQ